MISVRREDARDWPCPWLMTNLHGCSSRPERWALGEAIAYVKVTRPNMPVAVYDVRGCVQRRIYPPKGK